MLVHVYRSVLSCRERSLADHLVGIHWLVMSLMADVGLPLLGVEHGPEVRNVRVGPEDPVGPWYHVDLWCHVGPKWVVVVPVALGCLVALLVESDPHNPFLSQTIRGGRCLQTSSQEFCHQGFAHVGRVMPHVGVQDLRSDLVGHTQPGDPDYHSDCARLQEGAQVEGAQVVAFSMVASQVAMVERAMAYQLKLAVLAYSYYLGVAEQKMDALAGPVWNWVYQRRSPAVRELMA